jgi:transcriptional regulator GlxA family with amidase domain
LPIAGFVKIRFVDIVFLLYQNLTTLDAVGPYEVLWRIPGADVRMAAPEPGPQRDESGALALQADHALEDIERADVLVVPGGFGSRALMRDEGVLDWVRRIHEGTRFTTSVCTGSLILAGAGLLDGLPAATHWLQRDLLRELGAEPVPDRVVEQGKILTAAGVSSGIDMALLLAEHLAGEDMAKAIQLAIEYDPQPPFDSGSPEKADPETVEQVSAAASAKRRPA